MQIKNNIEIKENIQIYKKNAKKMQVLTKAENRIGKDTRQRKEMTIAVIIRLETNIARWWKKWNVKERTEAIRKNV